MNFKLTQKIISKLLIILLITINANAMDPCCGSVCYGGMAVMLMHMHKLMVVCVEVSVR